MSAPLKNELLQKAQQLADAMTQRTHIIPLGHPEPLHHASLGCWCHPLQKENGEMAVHNAKDGREKWERQGIIDQDRPWCLVYEDLK